MATRKRKKNTKPASKSIRELIRKAREAGHDTLGIMNDPETLGGLEFVVLVRTLTERFAARFERGSSRYAETIGQIMWEPVAKCIVRAMIRWLCQMTRVTIEVSREGSTMYGIAREAVASVRSRLGDDWITDDRLDQVAGLAVEVFGDSERFSFPTQFTCRGVPYTFHRDGDVLVVTRGDA